MQVELMMPIGVMLTVALVVMGGLLYKADQELEKFYKEQ